MVFSFFTSKVVGEINIGFGFGLILLGHSLYRHKYNGQLKMHFDKIEESVNKWIFKKLAKRFLPWYKIE